MMILPFLNGDAHTLREQGVPVPQIACAIYISVRERVRNVEPIRDFEQP